MMKVQTDFPIAYESYDHIEPKGTMNDNTHNELFVQHMESLFGRKITMSDWGCAGGGIVKDFLDAGHEAVGVEGSDYSLREKRAEWATIPDNLFTADITKPLFISDEQDRMPVCDLITAWDVLEHIEEKDLGNVIANVRNNLKYGGVFIASIATFPDHPHHVTLKEEDWWLDLFKKYKMISIKAELPNGTNLGRESSFSVVLKKV